MLGWNISRRLDMGEVVCVAALDRGTGYIKTCTSCDRDDADHYAKYYRNIGYRARIFSYDELEKYEKKMQEERCGK